ncbi:solute-binding protein [Desulfovibrio sulfodismutans]|uniref:Solute-binding protein n=1 Tax=Desulfolutivibrio sulfodismutans TaxID=63561 RepID=A0A7K3NJ89_9BACT|nr:substrate-binding domain-containing protein [Desulfolutivibrio sulfodismutans]NDY56268.1 solute-binding protein [Desulfolutivibrio sulfodismutans]QLA11322.1 tungsten ABC transporter substrate-binding protein [Desulfolutivibrio sulfodismutans DSM 3696]
MKTIESLLILLALGMLFGVTPCLAGDSTLKPLMLATTTSTAETGLLDKIVDVFAKEKGIELKYVAVGTGKALEIAKNCDADVVLVHAPDAEKAFVAAGNGLDRKEVMYNDFVLVGPKADPAKATGKDIRAALTRIHGDKALFISRGDNSGTHMLEKKLLKELKIEPAVSESYLESGQGMSATVLMAAEKGGYTLCDRASWKFFSANQGDKNPLAILVEGDPALLNRYSVMRVNPEKCTKTDPALAQVFLDWWFTPQAKEMINGHTKNGSTLYVYGPAPQ